MNDPTDDDNDTRARIDAWARHAAAAGGFADAERHPGALQIELRAKARRAAARAGQGEDWSRQTLEDRLMRDYALW
jgi:hypothetical protein